MKTRRLKTQRGMTLIELMIALTVLVIGLAALLALIMTGVASNSRNKFDTGGTFAAQAVLETIAGQPGGTDVNFKDCAGSSFTIKTASPAVGATPNNAGATLMTDGTGRIDFSAQTNSAVTAGYSMLYKTCGATGTQTTYDVRWNIQTISAYAKLVTVAAQSTSSVSAIGSSTQLRYFNPPVNLRTIVATGN